MKDKNQVDNSRGSVVWGINALRADGLSRLLDDLVDLEKTGLQRSQCDHVKAALSKISGRAAAIPDGSFWRGQIYKEFEAFADIYHEWNSREGTDVEAIKHRQDALRKLRRQRNSLATRIRSNQYVLQAELDLMLVEGMYSALRDLATAFPNIFNSLSLAVSRYEQRKSGRG